MLRLNITIKDEDKVAIVLNLLRELPFVEVEIDGEQAVQQDADRKNGSLADLFGIWENRNISLEDIRKKAWDRA